jgi:hypothetical protein
MVLYWDLAFAFNRNSFDRNYMDKICNLKKIIGVLILSGLSKIAAAQVIIALLFGEKLNTGKLEFGLFVNPVVTGISNLDSRFRTGLNLGLYFNIKISDNFFLHPEAGAKVSFGAKDIPTYPTGNDTLDALYKNGSIERKIKAFSLPLLCSYRIAGLFFAEAGIQVDLFTKSKDVYHTTVNDNDLDYTTKINDQVTRFDIGLAAGLVYRIKKENSMGFGIRYLHGVTDILKTIPGNQCNRVWQLTITVPVGAGKDAGQKVSVAPK